MLNKALNHRGTEDTEQEFQGLSSVNSVSRWLNQRFLRENGCEAPTPLPNLTFALINLGFVLTQVVLVITKSAFVLTKLVFAIIKLDLVSTKTTFAFIKSSFAIPKPAPAFLQRHFAFTESSWRFTEPSWMKAKVAFAGLLNDLLDPNGLWDTFTLVP